MSELPDDFRWSLGGSSDSLSPRTALPTELTKTIPPRPLGNGIWKHYGLGTCASPYKDGPEPEATTMEITLPTDPDSIIESAEKEKEDDEEWIIDHARSEVDLIEREGPNLDEGGDIHE